MDFWGKLKKDLAIEYGWYIQIEFVWADKYPTDGCKTDYISHTVFVLWLYPSHILPYSHICQPCMEKGVFGSHTLRE